MKVAFDLDATLCEEKPAFEKCLAKPFPRAKDKVNATYDAGDFVIIYTARGWNEYAYTKDWLDKNGFKYHILVCGKIPYDILYDDRAQPLNFLNNG